jgi:hypothetical protein
VPPGDGLPADACPDPSPADAGRSVQCLPALGAVNVNVMVGPTCQGYNSPIYVHFGMVVPCRYLRDVMGQAPRASSVGWRCTGPSSTQSSSHPSGQSSIAALTSITQATGSAGVACTWRWRRRRRRKPDTCSHCRVLPANLHAGAGIHEVTDHLRGPQAQLVVPG